ncbi:selenide, water dikinase SelD [Lyngbya aestuarii]|uniref:selenide, water dikinase SelD n=1 Tax=Lyngbya aestuarii TaxID=118322 RepID=UPI00403E07BC
MNSSRSPTKDLVLIGGGHSHAIALKKFGMQPLPEVRLTLITNVSETPYSGMLPGYVAGLYNFDQCHIDLRPLANFAQARIYVDRAIGLDLENNRVICANRPPVPFDLLSIDIGSTPAALTVPGAATYTIPVKPISQFLTYWREVTQEVTQFPHKKIRLAVVGGGAGGVELTLAVQAHLHRIYRQAQQPSQNLEIHLFQRGASLLPERHPWVGQSLQQILQRRGVKLHLRENVSAVQALADEPKANASTPKMVQCQSGLIVECDRVFWVTQASAAPWLRQSGLATDARGFIEVSDTLQSISHPQLFAAGDVATMVNHPRPKAGVFAVRQGQPLFDNLRRALLGKSLKSFVPQREFLILIGTGNRQALASRSWFGLGPNPLLWRWKDYIDRKFMEQFNNLASEMESQGDRGDKVLSSPSSDISDTAETLMRCGGCGAKVGSFVLERVLHRIRQENPDGIEREDILIGLDAPDDAAVISVPVGQVMVQTIDYFRSLLDDPFLLGQITANHCLSDIFAMGAQAQSVLAIATIPYAAPAKLEDTLYQLLSGATKVLNQAQAVLIGGHTTEGAELAFGLSCNGLVVPEQLLRKGGIKPGHVLILTKALGTGILFAADMRLKAKGRWIEPAIESMLLSNQAAATCLRQHQASACTDVTGFGLLGHLREMVLASQVAVELNLAAIPVLEGVMETLQQGIFSSLYPANLRLSDSIVNKSQVSVHPLYPLLFDPQTSGGLLASIPADQANSCLIALKNLGYTHSSIIGQVNSPVNQVQPIKIKE